MFLHLVNHSICWIIKKVVNIICSGWEKFVNWVDKNELMETVIFMIVINLTFIIVFFILWLVEQNPGFNNQTLLNRDISLTIWIGCNVLIIGYNLGVILFWKCISLSKNWGKKLIQHYPRLLKFSL